MKYLLLNFSLLLLNTVVTSRNVLIKGYGRKYQDPFQGLSFTFSCENRPPGFYADVKHACKIFHVCGENGRNVPVWCPYKTLFDQRQRMCTDEEDIPCEKSERWYYLDSSNYYTYFMESNKKAEVVLEEIEVYTVIPLDEN